LIVMLPRLAAAETRAAASPCQAPPFASGIAGATVDGRTFVLDDGREVRLAAIEAPPSGIAAVQATERLQALLSGKAVLLKGVGPERDRYGRLLAHVYLASSGAERWVQAELVASGHARVAARIGDHACAVSLIAHERAAREAKLGLWSDSYYAARRAEDPASVAAERGRFAIVEGNVLSVRETGGTIYVNFGRRWSEDFTVTIAKRNERAFAAAGLDAKKLAGRRVRIRGWIEERGGPWVEATRPEQIELVERN
jgi:endonuclease YncB( thermonuclease family)